MATLRSRIAARLRRSTPRKPPEAPARPAPAAALRGGLGEPPSASEAGEAELDTLRGELVRELDRMADGESGSASFRRIAS